MLTRTQGAKIQDNRKYVVREERVNIQDVYMKCRDSMLQPKAEIKLRHVGIPHWIPAIASPGRVLEMQQASAKVPTSKYTLIFHPDDNDAASLFVTYKATRSSTRLRINPEHLSYQAKDS